MRPGEGANVTGSSAFTRTSMEWTTRLATLEALRQWIAVREADLLAHEIETGHHLGHRVLDLDARVHLHEVEAAVLVEQELESTHVRVTDGSTPFFRRARAAPRAAWAGAPPTALLRRAFGVDAESSTRARRAPRRPRERPRRSAPRCAAAPPRKRSRYTSAEPKPRSASERAISSWPASASRLFTIFMPRPPPPAEALMMIGKPMRSTASCACSTDSSKPRARQDRHTGLDHGFARRDLAAHEQHHLRGGTDEADAAALAHLGEARVLRQKTVARMDGVGARDLGGADDGGDVQVRLRRGRGADADALVSELHVQRVGVRHRVDGHRRNAELTTRADHAQRDLATVGDQDLLETLVSSPGGS